MEDLRQLQDEMVSSESCVDFLMELRGDFRQLFDCFSGEWSSSSIEEKRGILSKFEDFGVSSERLMTAFQQTYLKAGREDIARSAKMSLRAIRLGSVLQAVAEREKEKSHARGL